MITQNLSNNISTADVISRKAEVAFKQALEEIKALTIPEYNVDRVALHMIVTWHDLFESIDRDSENIEEIEEIMQDANTWFTDTIHDSIVWEVAVENALTEITNSAGTWESIFADVMVLYNTAYQDKYPESKNYVNTIYDEIINKIANKVGELTKPEVIYYCERAISRRKKVNTRP